MLAFENVTSACKRDEGIATHNYVVEKHDFQQSSSHYSVLLNSTNALGTFRQFYTCNVYESGIKYYFFCLNIFFPHKFFIIVVIPAAPTNIVIDEVGTKTAKLSWHLSKTFENFSERMLLLLYNLLKLDMGSKSLKFRSI